MKNSFGNFTTLYSTLALPHTNFPDTCSILLVSTHNFLRSMHLFFSAKFFVQVPNFLGVIYEPFATDFTEITLNFTVF